MSTVTVDIVLLLFFCFALIPFYSQIGVRLFPPRSIFLSIWIWSHIPIISSNLLLGNSVQRAIMIYENAHGNTHTSIKIDECQSQKITAIIIIIKIISTQRTIEITSRQSNACSIEWVSSVWSRCVYVWKIDFTIEMSLPNTVWY